MTDEMAERYAKMVNEDDVVRLFGKLESIIGTRKEAADKCGITRTAVYNWKNLTQPMKTDTKEKVLEQLLEYLPLETLEYLTTRTFESSCEILLSYLKFLYERAFDAQDIPSFLEVVTKFEMTKKQYAGMIYSRFEYEVEDLTMQLVKQAHTIGATWNPNFLRVYDSPQLEEILIGLIDAIRTSSQTYDDPELAIRFGISDDLVVRVRQVLGASPGYVLVSLKTSPNYDTPRKIVKTVSSPFDTQESIFEPEFTGAATLMSILKVRK